MLNCLTTNLRLAVILMVIALPSHPSCSQSPASTISLPAFTAYAEPNPEAMQFSSEGVSGWKDAAQQLVWYGKLSKGKLGARVMVRIPDGNGATYRLTINGQSRLATAVGDGQQSVLAFDDYKIGAAGYFRFGLQGVKKSGDNFGSILSLELFGEATIGSHFSTVERRNAASVHLRFSEPTGAQAAWFYNEVTPKTDPIHTFYMACGFQRGYFGIQVNSPTERRIIFSIWDSGKEKNSREHVAKEDQVQLLAKGENVVASAFGGEGTGGHSHLVYSWKKNVTYRFLVTAKPVGLATIYTGYFWFPETKRWGLIASFRAPLDGKYITHTHSFIENFWGSTGQLRREAVFGAPWIKTPDNRWIALTSATFTHDSHGKDQRKDYLASAIVGGQFTLANGGFIAGNIKIWDILKGTKVGKAPDVGEFP